MNNLIRKLMFIMIILTITGCEKSKLTDLNGNEKSDFSIGETGVYENIEYTIKDVKYYCENDDSKDSEDNINYGIVALTFEIKNSTNKKIDSSFTPDLILELDGNDADGWRSDSYMNGVEYNDLGIIFEHGDIYKQINYYDLEEPVKNISCTLFPYGSDFEATMNVDLN